MEIYEDNQLSLVKINTSQKLYSTALLIKNLLYLNQFFLQRLTATSELRTTAIKVSKISPLWRYPTQGLAQFNREWFMKEWIT